MCDIKEPQMPQASVLSCIGIHRIDCSCSGSQQDPHAEDWPLQVLVRRFFIPVLNLTQSKKLPEQLLFAET